ncbi:permease prefix domain 1-containing protein [Actinophytocola sp.]|uniref:permease prefix domain 1-containing protein n=1 Tax=Actinophytocola sp. TaxID=1872138 RepID=UPI00389B274C
MIDAYLTALGNALRGPRRAKANLLAEARDHLLEATEAYQENGLDRPTAEAAAVADFGDLADIIPPYQAELSLSQGHRTALAMLSLSAAQPLVWATFARLSDTPEHPRLANEMVENLGGTIILLALLTAVAYRYGMRHPAIRLRLARLTGVAALTSCALLAAASILLTILSGGYLTPLWTATFVLAPAAYTTMSAYRCLHTRPKHPID